ncbi:MAG: tRNA-adenosine deaminase [Candidatus Atelocyanobacterium thalassa isolate SIO64986]|uniref:tRNA-specific adenosine deaminase n=1 Tax=Candidatus Atelocyanobacterium thalassa isolate SIO64986 TaxID=1527444 RepID=A0A086CFG5_9CHRO|nr:MAG: tRNA-adenosine deaminase [Candidatus Atelocyanobacterium thalassa isolate SIO64986]
MKNNFENNYEIHRQWMRRALTLAEKAGNIEDVPVGAIITDNYGNLIAEGYNRKKQNNDPIGHAEILAIRQASQKLQSCYLDKCILYVTLEPCMMCTGAIIHSRIGLLVYGIDDPKAGTVRTILNLPDSDASNHRLPVLSGILKEECQKQLQNWFKTVRDKKRINEK